MYKYTHYNIDVYRVIHISYTVPAQLKKSLKPNINLFHFTINFKYYCSTHLMTLNNNNGGYFGLEHDIYYTDNLFNYSSSLL